MSQPAPLPPSEMGGRHIHVYGTDVSPAVGVFLLWGGGRAAAKRLEISRQH